MKREVLASISFCFLLGGCHGALSEMRRDVKTLEQEIQEDEESLQALRAERAERQEVIDDLVIELESEQVTLADLHLRLDALERENQQIKVKTATQQEERDKLDRAIREYKEEIAELSRKDVSNDRKKLLIEDLKRRIRVYFEIQLRQK
jgi:chromosome segregation ATPase